MNMNITPLLYFQQMSRLAGCLPHTLVSIILYHVEKSAKCFWDSSPALNAKIIFTGLVTVKAESNVTSMQNIFFNYLN